ncbi:EmrB/QacA subfamily drug resistance transporter [Antricoccus suffuscus]|uniref:EmrB/QacA subfamily drug resistance transporter n=1 Tax=Antricoccus suffuscus TaxID=1629062 RepID=A0A2T1A681_9ACTN|nr:MDR family MFS transporter [Antricoccus suffuscus]PRZ44099.1 EmrB/QacA subfamily drug resistance transporter [Antricoccus suffuscus]
MSADTERAIDRRLGTRDAGSRDREIRAPETNTLVPLFIGLMLAMLLAALNQTVLSTALPTIVGELNGVHQMTWVITAYILASTIVMPIYGKVGDQIGRRGLMFTAILLFVSGSIIGGLAQDMTWLIIARTVQGLGGGGLILLSQAIIADVVPARERGKYMGIMGSVFAVSSVAGPLLGGWFTEVIGWRWAFWINLPLGALALGAALIFLKLPRQARGAGRFDVVGMALMMVSSSCLILVATWGGNEYAWSSGVILGLIGATVATAYLFVMVERRASNPIIPLHLFKERNFNLTTTAGLFTGIAMFGVLGYMPTYLQMATGANATKAGLLMVPMMAGFLVTSIVTGQMVSRSGRYRMLPIVGSFVWSLALWLLSIMTVQTPVWLICAYLSLLGIGIGMGMQILVLIVQNSFPNREVGTATASNNFFRQIGASLGSAVVGSLFATRLVDLLAQRMPADALSAGGGSNRLTPELVSKLPPELHEPVVSSYNDALAPIFMYMVPLGIAAALLLWFVHEKPLATTIDREVAIEPATEGFVSLRNRAR